MCIRDRSPEIRDRAKKKPAEEQKEYKVLKAGQKAEKEDTAQVLSVRIKDKRYNTFYYQDHKDGFCCFWWVDNNVVKMVLNVHTGALNEVVSCNRKHPCTKKYRKLWSGTHLMEIKIPKLVGDYNNWMKGKFLVKFVLKCRVMQNSDILSSSNYAVFLYFFITLHFFENRNGSLRSTDRLLQS